MGDEEQCDGESEAREGVKRRLSETQRPLTSSDEQGAVADFLTWRSLTIPFRRPALTDAGIAWRREAKVLVGGRLAGEPAVQVDRRPRRRHAEGSSSRL